MLCEEKLRLTPVVVLMVALALMEGTTVALLVPLLTVVMGEQGTLPGVLGNFGVLIENVLKFFNIDLSLIVVLIMITAAFVVQGLLHLLSWHFQAKMFTRYEFSLIHKLFDSYLASSWSFFVRSQVGELVNILSGETGRALLAFRGVCEILASLLIVAFYIILSLLASWQITLAGIVLCSASSLVLRKFMERPYFYGCAISNTQNELQAYAFDKLTAAKLLKCSATEEAALDNMDAIARRKVHLSYLSWMNSASIPGIYRPLAMASLSLVIYFAITYLKVNFATILLFTFIFYRLTPYFASLQHSYQQTLLNIPALQEIDKTVELARSMAEVKDGGKEMTGFREAIVFDNVSFTYRDGVSVLKSINLEIKKGESVAIVGESGVGKTTFVDSLLGLFTPTKGRIVIDGVPLSDYDLASWRRLIGHISQDVFLFHDTIRANLKWMAPRASTEEIEAAARTAHAHQFIMNMPKGYDSVIGDRGIKLSGGQRQRLALARMILQNPEIIILDEATSALDVESEAKVQEAIEKITANNKTVILISHRASMLKNVERVYQLENGSLSEAGKGDEFPSRRVRFKEAN